MRGLSRLILLFILVVVTFAPAATHAQDIDNFDFERTWSRTDQPVQSQTTDRTWMWGPGAFTEAKYEPYAESPNGARLVQYFDKSRMEITDPDGDTDSIWYVTNGLIAQELITGQRQMGDDTFVDHGPAHVNVAGDGDDPEGPTYATFSDLMDLPALDEGASIIQTVDREGEIGDDQGLANHGVTAAHHVPETEHTVASPFWEFMNSSGTVYELGRHVDGALFENPFYATGFPLTEAYWTNVRVGDEPRQVLVQVFERRVLTYTPDNPQGWQVEAGNVGQHYYNWRYELEPDVGSRQNPVPMGEPVDLADGWEVRVLNITPDATQDVLDENQFNDPPEAGHQFFIAEVEATYHGSGSDRFSGSYRLRTVGDAGVSYSTFSNSCGVIPNDLPDPETFTGGSISGNLCWEVRSEDVNSLVMFDDEYFADPPPRIYMALFE